LFKAIIFDWFNTLAYCEPPREEVHSRVLRDFGINITSEKLISPLLKADIYFFDENIKSPIHRRKLEEKQDVYIRYEEIILSEVGIKTDRSTLEKIYIQGDLTFNKIADFAIFKDVLPALKSLKERRFILGLLTNLDKDMNALCRRLGIAPYIDFTVTPSEAKADKPDPAIFQTALNKAGVKANEAIYIGDQYKSDILGARNVKMRAILIDRYNLNPEVDCPRITNLFELDRYLN
jgi:HAD superfamily hydrolase (TIGR01549 family)